MEYTGRVWEPIELDFTASVSRKDPFNEIEMDLRIADSEGKIWTVPCFWAGKDSWKARFSAPHSGTYAYTTACTDTTDNGLHSQSGTISVADYDGENPLYIHGPIEIMPDHRHFMYHDGTPFAWLGDTWWPLACSRISEDGEVQRLAKDRVEKGFNLIHVVNGFWCDVAPYDKRLANAAGFAWTEDFATINPGYYEIADKKIEIAADAGLVIAMAYTWGFYIRFMGLEKMRKHVRYTIARYGAYNTIWLTAGETAMPYYDYSQISPMCTVSEEFSEQVINEAKRDWSEIIRYTRRIDPYKRLITAHTTLDRITVDDIDDPDLVDFIIYQAGSHDGNRPMVSDHVSRLAKRGLSLENKRPVLNSECCYEGMLYQCGAELQRWLFWHTALDGTAGWTYGANGLFNMCHENDSFGTCYYGTNWGEQTWQEAIDFMGAKQVGASRKYLNRYEWWKLEPAYDITEDPAGKPDYEKAIAARIGDDLIVAYMQRIISWSDKSNNPYVMRFKNLKPKAAYAIKAYNPIRDYEIDLGQAEVGIDGKLVTPVLPIMQDWAVFMTRV